MAEGQGTSVRASVVAKLLANRDLAIKSRIFLAMEQVLRPDFSKFCKIYKNESDFWPGGESKITESASLIITRMCQWTSVKNEQPVFSALNSSRNLSVKIDEMVN